MKAISTQKAPAAIGPYSQAIFLGAISSTLCCRCEDFAERRIGGD